MAGIATGTASATSKSKLVAQWMIVTIAIAASYFAISKLIETGRKVIAQRPPATVEAVYTHCIQFILLAQAKYADDWRFRLDPRDTICADQVQAEWERQSAERRAQVELERRPTFTEAEHDGPASQEANLDGDASRSRNPETYCLNMMSLARTRSGPDWKAKLTPQELAGCEAAVDAAPN